MRGREPNNNMESIAGRIIALALIIIVILSASPSINAFRYGDNKGEETGPPHSSLPSK